MTIVRLLDTFRAVTSSIRGGRILMDLSAAKRGSENGGARKKKRNGGKEGKGRAEKRT